MSRERSSGRSTPRGDAVDAGTAHPSSPIAAWVVWCILAAVLLLAAPESNGVWAVNGFRSVSWGVRFALLLGAGGAWLAARSSTRPGTAWGIASVALAALVAWPLHETLHVLGDTEMRLHAIAAFDGGQFGLTLREWSHHLHAQPLDVLIDFLLPIGLHRLGLTVGQSVRIVSFALALLLFAGIWRVSRQHPSRLRLPICWVLALSGVLEAFAGYSESAGLFLVAGVWWWAEMLAPLDRRRAAWRLLAAWAVAFLAHRQALALVPAMLLRAWLPIRDGDRREVSRLLLAGTLVAVAAGVALAALSASAAELAGDMADFVSAITAWMHARRVPPFPDALNLAVLVAPLIVVAPALLATPRAGTSNRRLGLLFAAAIVPLLPLLVTVLIGPHELGAHRDWDVAAFLGWTASLAAMTAIAARPVELVRRVLLAGVPVLALLAGSWVAVNADRAASERRAEVLAKQRSLPEEQRSMLEMFLGQHAMNESRSSQAAEHFDRAYALAPNPRYLLLAAEAWARAGRFTAARNDVRRAWASGALNERKQQAARILARVIDDLDRKADGDSARDGSEPGAGAPDGGSPR